MGVRITNKTRGTTLASDADVARTLPSRMKGLIGRKSLAEGRGLVITPCTSIHTFGMRFSIDALFFDRGCRVLSVVRDLKPLRVSKWYPRAKGVLELPAGSLSASSAEPGDELAFE